MIEHRLTGLVRAPGEFIDTRTLKEKIETPSPQPAGKEICAQLKKLRAEIAKENGISLEQKPCNNTAQCAGTCAACDEEIRLLNHCLLDDMEECYEDENTIKGKVVRISRMRKDTDGKGISTLVALHGCPIHCAYCLNRACRNYDTATEKYTPQELVKVISIDELYYKNTGGGVVFGGGEPLLQADFIEEVCEKIIGKYDIRVETSLNVPWEKVRKLLPYVDSWIVDIKDINPSIYKRYTTCDNAIVLENLEKLAKSVAKEKIVVRVPRIPGYNKKRDVLRSWLYVKKLGLKPEVFTYQQKRF